jgi:NitT/TauT family transport system substrate-binding protein
LLSGNRDRTKGKQNVKRMASLGHFPYYLVSNNPAVKTIADFTDKDRIALPAATLERLTVRRWGQQR